MAYTDQHTSNLLDRIEAVSLEEKNRARRFVAGQATDAEDLRSLLDMLGLREKSC